MPRNTTAPGTPEDWLLRAKSNLALAGQPKPEGAFWEDQCFQAHQAVEKALKAVYIRRGLLFKFVHDIDELENGLAKSGLRIPPIVRRAIVLTRYAFEARYPGPYEAATEKDYRVALEMAQAVIDWAEKTIQTPDKPGGPLLQEPHAAYKIGKTKKLKAKKRK
jgi:HEPN domain-containing protein